MPLGMMSPEHKRWPEFIVKMTGSEGCNFRKIKARGERDTWTCDNSLARPIARRILAAMGASESEIDQSLGFFAAFGGNCDCEIVFNVESASHHYYNS